MTLFFIILLCFFSNLYAIELQEDLDGNNSIENIVVTYGPSFGIKIGKKKAYAELSNRVHQVKIIDINDKDKYKEIQVTAYGNNAVLESIIFRYYKKKIINLGKFKGNIKITGNNFIYVKNNQGFWEQLDKYQYDETKKKYILVQQPFYYINKPVYAKESFFLHLEHKLGSKSVAKVEEQTDIDLIGAWIDKNNKIWYLLKCETGLIGWADENAVKKHVSKLY